MFTQDVRSIMWKCWSTFPGDVFHSTCLRAHLDNPSVVIYASLSGKGTTRIQNTWKQMTVFIYCHVLV